MRCESTKYGRPCNASAFCTFRKRVKLDGKWTYISLIVCEEHSKAARFNDTYIDSHAEESDPGTDSPYWSYQTKKEQEDLEEPAKANPDVLSEENAPWHKSDISEEDEKLLSIFNEEILSFTKKERLLISLLSYQGMTNVEAANFLEISQQAVNAMLKRIQTKAKRMLK